MKHAEIAGYLFVGTATLSRWKKRMGITDRRSVYDYYRLRDIERLPDCLVAQRWGITKSALYSWKIANNVDSRYFARSSTRNKKNKGVLT